MSSTQNPRAVASLVKPRTEAEDKLWQALLDNPGSTAGTLSTTAGIGKSTAPKILARWQKDGLATRTTEVAEDGSRPGDRWSITDDGQPADDEPTALESAGAAASDSASPDAGSGHLEKAERLAPGALRGQVEDYLRDHGGMFSPNAIGKALNRSSGAVHNALEKLVTSGYAVRTSDKPKKYSLAGAPAVSPEAGAK